MGLPSEQNAAVKTGSGGEAKAPVQRVAVPEPGPGQILVKINWTGLCASDKSLLHDEWAAFGVKMADASHGIAGHEGAGEVVAVHPDVQDLWQLGDRAGIKWVVSTCKQCEFCLNGTDELHCTKQLNSGFTIPGTFQQYALTDAKYATRLPDGVLDEQAGPIMCGGVTAYVACKRSAVRPGQWLVVSGAGGGLGHLGVQYAKAMGMRVIAIDGGVEKGKLCKDLGAEEYLDFTTGVDIAAEVTRITKYGSHGVIVFAASKESYASAPGLLRPGGTMVAVGIPGDPSVIAGAPPVQLALRRLNVVGSVTGTLKEVEEAYDITVADDDPMVGCSMLTYLTRLDFTARGLVHPILTKGTLDDVDKFCSMMKDGQLPGRAVLKVSA